MIYDDNGNIKNDNPTPTPANESVWSEINTRQYKNYAQTSNVVVERPIPKNTTAKKDNKE